MLVMSFQVLPPLVDDCHLVILPVLPLKVMVPLLMPGHTEAEPDVVPPTDVGFTVIVTTELLADEQGELVTTALY